MAEPHGSHGHGFTCQEVVAIASEYLEGAMAPEQMTAFEVHLNFCDGCLRFIDQMRETTALAHSLSDDEIPAELKSELLAVFRDLRRE